MADPKDDPSTQSSERKAMDAAWSLIGDVLAGAVTVRAAKTKYLPKYEDESQREYDRRCGTAPWRPEFADALGALAAKPFDQDVGLKGDVSEEIKALAEDIDGRGNSLTRFSAETFRHGIARGVDAIFVDFPTMALGATRADEKAANARPYWIPVRGDAIVALYTDWVGGKEIITHFRFRECVKARDGFGETERQRIRVYEPGCWEIWEQDPKNKEWALAKDDSGQEMKGTIARGESDGASVPVALFFTGERQGELQVQPPLAGLADLQMELYRALSREDEVLTYASSPMLTANGMGPPKGEDGKAVSVTVGPKSVLFAPSAGDGSNPSWAYINPDAANIEQVSKHVRSIIDDMRRLGMQPTIRQAGAPTATGESIDAAKAHSALEAWAMSLKDALEQAWVYTCEWLKEPATVEVTVNTDFDVMPFAQAPLTALATARAAKDISQRTFWDGLRRFDVLPQDFDPDAEEGKLAEEGAPLEPEEPIDPRTGAPLGDGSLPDDALSALFAPEVLGTP